MLSKRNLRNSRHVFSKRTTDKNNYNIIDMPNFGMFHTKMVWKTDQKIKNICFHKKGISRPQFHPLLLC